jgi:nicotinamide-nucleotide amidase
MLAQAALRLVFYLISSSPFRNSALLMRAEILCVGTELLLGQIIDTNAATIGAQLARAGVDVLRKQTAGDNLERIADCIRGALSRCDALIITGGQGPTTDDLTREALALSLGVELETRPELEEKLRAFFAARGMEPSATTMRQAQLPVGAQAIPNPVGTAPGVLARTQTNQLIFAIPGVPREMKAMLNETIIPTLLEKLEGERQIIVSRVLRSFGVGESSLSEPLEDILTTAQNPTVAPLIFGNTEVHLRLTAKARDEAEAGVLLDEMEAKLRERAGASIFGCDAQTLASVVIDLLRERGSTLSLAESLTGGLTQTLITEIPGASAVFVGGASAYSDAIKEKVLAVPHSLIEKYSAVSGEVACAMAGGARELFDSDFALSLTGEAGPEANTASQIGTVWIALSHAGSTLSYRREYHGDREAIRRRAAHAALDILRRHLLNLPLE